VEIVRASLKRRHAAEKRFRLYGRISIGLGLIMLFLLLFSIFSHGYRAFFQTYIELDVYFDAAKIDPAGRRDPETLASADYAALLKQSLAELFPEVQDQTKKRALYRLLSAGAGYRLRDMVVAAPELIGTTTRIRIAASREVDRAQKEGLDRNLAESERRLGGIEFVWIERLAAQGRLQRRFNWDFFTSGDSRDPEQAGIGGALMGSFLTLLVTSGLSLPIGVGAAIYLEEFAPRNRWVDFIEVNINNLAAVPSIVFGLLGLAVFIDLFGAPRSSPLVGGLVLALMTLPVIIIASRSALRAVPPSIREAALAVGASQMQMVFHHVVPLAFPGMLTGAIIGMSRALGESAPLLMVGMVAFIVDIPRGIFDPATVLPVQVYLWADSPERGFVERTSAAIVVLLVFLIVMNGLAVYLRRRYERRW